MEEAIKRHGMFIWQELMTGDVDGAKKFYMALLGWSAEEFPMEGDGSYWVMKVGEEGVGGIMQTPPEAKGVPPYWGGYIMVDDVDTTAKKAQTLGGQIIAGPMDIPKVGRFATLRDPQGAVFSVIKPAEM